MAENDTDFRYTLVTKGFDALKTLIRTSGVVLVAYLLYRTIVPFAGQQSEADIRFLMQIITDLQADRWIAYLLTGGSIGYGLRERRLRKRYIERFSRRIKDLEQGIDPQRSSSGLPPTGESRPED